MKNTLRTASIELRYFLIAWMLRGVQKLTPISQAPLIIHIVCLRGEVNGLRIGQRT